MVMMMVYEWVDIYLSTRAQALDFMMRSLRCGLVYLFLHDVIQW